MSRWYYTDPLAAAWMAKHFDFYIGWYEEERWCKHSSVEDIVAHPMSAKLYIHPDSLPLLEPKCYDIIEAIGMGAGCPPNYYYMTYENFHSWNILNPNTPHTLYKIIQRNGLPFMWPEQEKE